MESDQTTTTTESPEDSGNSEIDPTLKIVAWVIIGLCYCLSAVILLVAFLRCDPSIRKTFFRVLAGISLGTLILLSVLCATFSEELQSFMISCLVLISGLLLISLIYTLVVETRNCELLVQTLSKHNWFQMEYTPSWSVHSLATSHQLFLGQCKHLALIDRELCVWNIQYHSV